MATIPPTDTSPTGDGRQPTTDGGTGQPDTGSTKLTSAGADFAAEADTAKPAMFAGARQAFKDEAGKLTQTGIDKAKSYAVDGKDRAGGALDEFARLMTDAAGTVDEKLGAQYGDYARSAANSLSGFAETLRNKDVDDLLEDAKELVKKSPAVAIGTAAAVGFVLARLVKTGLDNAPADDRRA